MRLLARERGPSKSDVGEELLSTYPDSVRGAFKVIHRNEALRDYGHFFLKSAGELCIDWFLAEYYVLELYAKWTRRARPTVVRSTPAIPEC